MALEFEFEKVLFLLKLHLLTDSPRWRTKFKCVRSHLLNRFLLLRMQCQTHRMFFLNARFFPYILGTHQRLHGKPSNSDKHLNELLYLVAHQHYSLYYKQEQIQPSTAQVGSISSNYVCLSTRITLAPNHSGISFQCTSKVSYPLRDMIKLLLLDGRIDLFEERPGCAEYECGIKIRIAKGREVSVLRHDWNKQGIPSNSH